MGVINAMTVDVEDYYQVSAFEKVIDRAEWTNRPSRVDQNTLRCLDLFLEAKVKATFFVLGIVAEQYPDLVRKIADQGHEVASHGYSHVRVMHQNEEEFLADIDRTKKILEDLSAKEVLGYRAASYSISRETPWAYDALVKAGYRYSSSVYPINHDLYGDTSLPRLPYPVCSGALTEIPITTMQVLGRNFPVGGGGYFRLFPYSYSSFGLKRVNKQSAGVFYFHPWELDPEQPRELGLPLKTRFRHYTNLGKMEPKLKKLLSDFEWGRLADLVSLEHHQFL
ncbi:MAG TPA: polysaccharide deacetylase family protein [Gammaproteobacteria bacterium]|nr:polysaccharide deacetylase family protein [Gammaproteobacteria bacterium]